MIDRKALLADLIKQVKAVEADLAEQVKDGEAVLKPLKAEHAKAAKADAGGTPQWPVWLEARAAGMQEDQADRIRLAESGAGRLRAEYDRARELERTAATWNAWLDERVTQVAVAWVLGTVFVRFCEDNRLIPDPYLTGAEPERRDLAEARYAQYVEEESNPTFRGWLERAFAELGAGEAGKLLFNPRRNPLYQIPLSHDGARKLVEFWRERDDADVLVHDFTDPLNADGTEGWDTRFLGDLYQDLSEAARKTYALLQTPEFVEEFILDRTMDPVVREMGGRLPELKMIDPTCGSGHFVLGAFRRMVRLLAEKQPGMELHERVRTALNAVHGVDINPFAVAIARFRLLMAAMAAANIRTLAEASRYDWPMHLAVGDSLIKARQLEFGLLGGTGQGELEFTTEQRDELAEFSYSTEDLHEHKNILEQGRYGVVVGNPPYIQVEDTNLNKVYRELYKSCAGTYSLSVPFAERFFQLANIGEPSGRGYGMIGQITGNSFMKREFGTKLIAEYFAHKVELTEVIDTSGAYIPGHGTPTVILIGRRRAGKDRTATIRTVRSIQSEPTAPENAEHGLVWTAITKQIDDPTSVSKWVSVDDLDRARYFGKQPWILSDGGLEMVESIESSSRSRLSSISSSIGRTTSTGADDIFFWPNASSAQRFGYEDRVRPLVAGDAVRDFGIVATVPVSNPYLDRASSQLLDESDKLVSRHLWLDRTRLRTRKIFGKTLEENGRSWYVHLENYPSKLHTDSGVTFAFVATHNHFTFDSSGKLFNRTAPVIKLPDTAQPEDYLRLVGALNSSTACFWLKQVSHNKGRPGAEQAGADEPWEHRFEFTGTKLGEFPLPSSYPTELASEVHSLAQRLTKISPAALTSAGKAAPSAESLRSAKSQWAQIRGRMISLQEEMDWQVYATYGLLNEQAIAAPTDVPELGPADRAFAIVLARKIERGEVNTSWFTHHNHNFPPITEIPAHWPDSYKAVVQKRIDVIETSRAIGMVERPEYKRRWATEGWDVLQERALKSWLLDRIENRDHWFDENGQPAIVALHQLTDALSRDEDFVSVAEIYASRKELATVVSDLLADDHVPFLAALRYKPAALKKRADWEHVWDLQRQEDAATEESEKRKIRDSIPVPPKYTSADFLKASYWKARGKLDVPKERFISYATGAISGTPTLFGWAGWDHREQAQALSTYFTNHDELSAEELTPLLAGLLELQPWLTQWHDEFDGLYGGSPAAFFEGYRSAKQGEHGLTDDDLRAWRPPATVRRTRKAAKG
ncbi:BREX-2 system adenine-specific DNA-methyltransferase PglX [Streptomyces sp. NPDC051567]|uniref:BREX-2 system adenine-specific DNA-methyltransferase PglX n=1 Tax=Streptomyces sp. NPDC051567 TaxID=3365660 RepID=UPI00379DD6C1